MICLEFGTTLIGSNESRHDLGPAPNEVVSISPSTQLVGKKTVNTAFTVMCTAVAGVRFGDLAMAPAAAVP